MGGLRTWFDHRRQGEKRAMLAAVPVAIAADLLMTGGAGTRAVGRAAASGAKAAGRGVAAAGRGARGLFYPNEMPAGEAGPAAPNFANRHPGISGIGRYLLENAELRGEADTGGGDGLVPFYSDVQPARDMGFRPYDRDRDRDRDRYYLPGYGPVSGYRRGGVVGEEGPELVLVGEEGPEEIRPIGDGEPEDEAAPSYGPEDEESYLRQQYDLLYPDDDEVVSRPARPAREDESTHGFFGALSRMGRNPVGANIDLRGRNSGIAAVLGLASIYANARASQETERAEGAKRRNNEAAREFVREEGVARQEESRLKAERRRRLAFIRQHMYDRQRDQERDAAQQSRRDTEFERTHTQLPSGKWVPSGSEAGVRASDPRLAREIHTDKQPKSDTSTALALEQIAERERAEAYSQAQAAWALKKHKGQSILASGDRTPLPDSVRHEYPALVAADRKMYSAQAVRAIASATTATDLQRAVRVALERGLESDQDVDTALREAERRIGVTLR